MTAAIAVRDHLDVRGSLVIAVLLLGVVACHRIYEATLFARERALTRKAIRDTAHGLLDRDPPVRVVETDHEPCTSCGHIICFCDRPGQCLGTTNVGCLHLTHPDLLCTDCRTSCAECRAEDHVEQAIALCRDEAAVRNFR